MYLCFVLLLTHTNIHTFTNPASNIHPVYWAMNFQVPEDIHPNWVDVFTLRRLLHAAAECIAGHYVKDYQRKSWCTRWVIYHKMDKKLENKHHQCGVLWLIVGNSAESKLRWSSVGINEWTTKWYGPEWRSCTSTDPSVCVCVQRDYLYFCFCESWFRVAERMEIT